jgi:hypothetical protein
MTLGWRILGGYTTRFIDSNHMLHKAVDERMKAISDYKPANVLDYLSRLAKKKRTREGEDHEEGKFPLKKARANRAFTTSSWVVSP